MSGPERRITIFAMPKAFSGHFAVIQRNAITSWTHIRPRPEILLCGDDPGTAEIAAELGLHHIAQIARTPSGTPRLDDLFAQAEDAVPDGLLCYVNADIMLPSNFHQVVQRLAGWSPLMMIGRRWDTNITEPWDFTRADWEDRLRAVVHGTGTQMTPDYVDYFLFTKGLGRDILPFALGRLHWDHWLVWHARKRGAFVVDASAVVVAVHQNHDYSHHPTGRAGIWGGEEAARNRALVGDYGRWLTIDDADHRLTADGIERRYRYLWHALSFCWRHPRRFAKMTVRSVYLGLRRLGGVGGSARLPSG
jgi:hypothetical protein